MSDLSKPLVSVVISTYNYAKYLPTAVKSVLNQTYKNLEIIIVNDGSTDNTDEVIAPYLKDERIKYIKQKNAGQASAKNCGIKNTSGDYIAFLDADDYWRSDKLEKQLNVFTNDNAVGVVYSGLKFINPNNEIDNSIILPQMYSGHILQELFIDNFIGFSTAVVKKECFDKVGCFDVNLPMAIDWDLWLRIACFYKFEYANEHLLYYRYGHANMSRNTEKRIQCSDFVMERFLKENQNKLKKETVKKAFQLTYNRRGAYYINYNFLKGINYLVKSFLIKPFQVAPAKIILKYFFNTIIRKNKLAIAIKPNKKYYEYSK